MFDFMIKGLKNGRILIRNLDTKESENMKASELQGFLESAFAAELQEEAEITSKQETMLQEYKDSVMGKDAEKAPEPVIIDVGDSKD